MMSVKVFDYFYCYKKKSTRTFKQIIYIVKVSFIYMLKIKIKYSNETLSYNSDRKTNTPKLLNLKLQT